MVLSNSFIEYLSGSPVKYKKVGNIVYLKGAVTPTSEISANSSTLITTLPTGFRPASQNAVFVCQGSGMNRWALTVTPNGLINVERYGIATNIAIPVGAWLPFDVCFSI